MFGINGSNTTYVGPIDNYAGGNIIYGANANVDDHDFYTGGTLKMRIKADGNVGIGTNAPAGKLMVREDAAGSPARIIVSNGGTSQSGTASRLSFYEGTTEKSYIERRRDGSGKTAFVTPADDNPFVWENPTGEFMRFTNSKVGIGTNSPDTLLHIKNTGNGAVTTLKLEDNAREMYLGRDSLKVTALDGSTASQFYINSNTTFSGTVTTGGNLAVTGAVTATSTLSTGYGVALTNGATNFLMYNNSTENVLYMRDTTNGAMIQTWGVNTVTMNKNLVSSGTTTCSSTLNANSNIYLADNMTLYVGTDTTNGIRMFHLSSNNNNYFRSQGGALSIETMAAQPIYFNTQNVGAMTIDTSQRVGIGTTSPSFKLKVNVDNGTYTDMETIAAFQSKRGADTEYEAGIMINSMGDCLAGSISSNLYWTDNIMAKGNTGRSGGAFQIDNSASNESQFLWRGTPYNSTTLTNYMMLDNTQSLHVDADVVAYSSSVSDERLKDNIKTIPNALDKVMQLRGVEFDWNATSRKGNHDIGVIAQEVEKVLPEIVKEHTLCTGEFTNNEKEFKTVDYDKMIGVLIEAIKEQQVQIDELKTHIGE